MSMTMIGLARNTKIDFRCSFPDDRWGINSDPAINSTGNNGVRKLLKVPGSLFSGITSLVNVSSGLEGILRSVLANNGPARIMDGMATMSPNINVFPILAPNMGTSAEGDGCGGRKPCVTDNAAKSGTPIYTAGSLY